MIHTTPPKHVTLKAWMNQDDTVRLLWFDDGDYRCLVKQEVNVGLIFKYPGKWEFVGHDLGYLLDDDKPLPDEEAVKFWESARQDMAALLVIES